MKEIALNKEKYLDNYSKLNKNTRNIVNLNLDNPDHRIRKSSNLEHDYENHNNSLRVECDDSDYKNDNMDYFENKDFYNNE